MACSIPNKRPQSLGEEIANSISHGIGLAAAIALTPILIIVANANGGATEIVASSIFGSTLILMYLMSTLYHALPQSRAKRIFKILDHCAIYILIAGTYTPFTLVVLGGAWGWSIFGVIWGLALLGVIFKTTGGLRYPGLSIAIYILMGWMVLIAIKPLWEQIPLWGFIWLCIGGAAYTLGVIFYVAHCLRYNHLIWHLFVLSGTSCHCIAVFNYATS